DLGPVVGVHRGRGHRGDRGADRDARRTHAAATERFALGRCEARRFGRCVRDRRRAVTARVHLAFAAAGIAATAMTCVSVRGIAGDDLERIADGACLRFQQLCEDTNTYDGSLVWGDETCKDVLEAATASSTGSATAEAIGDCLEEQTCL